VGDNATVSASAHFHNLQLQKSPSRVFGQNSGNSADISKAFFEVGISKFESSQVSQAFRRLVLVPTKCANGPETAGFRAFDFVSTLPIRRTGRANCRKSPTASAKIPVLRRLRSETLVRSATACRRRQSISRAEGLLRKSLSVASTELSMTARQCTAGSCERSRRTRGAPARSHDLGARPRGLGRKTR
jgi:hypothetical protein